jgi:hypothetical protein
MVWTHFLAELAADFLLLEELEDDERPNGFFLGESQH